MWAHIWAPMQPPPTFNFGHTSNFFFVYHTLSMRQKTKNHQNQGSIDKKFHFFPQSLTHIPRWVHLVQKTRAKNSHAWAPLRYQNDCFYFPMIECKFSDYKKIFRQATQIHLTNILISYSQLKISRRM